MQTIADLQAELHRLDGKPYGAYRDLVGRSFDLGEGVVFVLDRAQTDPYAPPSLAHLEVPNRLAGLAKPGDRPGLTAAEDFITRQLVAAVRAERDISFGRPGQEILERTTVRLDSDCLIARLTIQLPARGRRILGHAAAKTLGNGLPRIVHEGLRNLDHDGLEEAMAYLRDVDKLRSWLAAEGLVAFVGDGANLARRAGNSDAPKEGAVAFQSPQTLRRSVELPSGRTVTGMAIPRGVTVIVGGGYHGKSTLLRALQLGVYPHIPGDGREWVVTLPDAVAIRAEDGRAVAGLDISPFISNLPSGEDTRAFSTANASGSTSQAANLVEALEAGARTLLIDEDTSVTNFMLRDQRMRELISPDKEPITPFVERVRELFDRFGISTVLVAGGSGAFFDVADHVIALDAYQVFDVTDKALSLAGRSVGDAAARSAEDPALDSAEGPSDAPATPAGGGANPEGKAQRRPVLRVAAKPQGKGPHGGKGSGRGRGRKPAGSKGRATIKLGKDTVELGPAEQLVDPAQTTGIAHAIDWLEKLLDGSRTLPEALDQLEDAIDAEGLDAIAPYSGHPGLFARPRRHEIMAAVNRFRGLRA